MARALILDKGNAEAHYIWHLRNLKHFELSKWLVEEVLVCDVDHKEAKYELGLLYLDENFRER